MISREQSSFCFKQKFTVVGQGIKVEQIEHYFRHDPENRFDQNFFPCPQHLTHPQPDIAIW